VLALARRPATSPPTLAPADLPAAPDTSSDGSGGCRWAHDTLGNGVVADALQGAGDPRLAGLVRDALDSDVGGNAALQRRLFGARRPRAAGPSAVLLAEASALGADLFLDPEAALEVA
jgi:hypothetical protein